ncbi:TonB-dependent receptor [Daejeonella sp.]|uniref:TonB-dependent receptor domain-containing protein n=1 Tax=Daejeonella sp. TaxID=2805397 RepID=UPI0030C27EB3
MTLNKLALLILLSLTSISAFSQTSSIKGLVFDKSGKTPVEFASVALFKTADSSLVAGMITKANGGFDFRGLQSGNYRLKIAFIGYDSKVVSEIVVASGQILDLGNVQIQPGSQMLNQVNITGEKLDALSKIDKQTYRAGQFESAKGGNAVDVLKNLPSVSVDGQGEISIRGSSGFLVLINGKPVLTDAQTVLSQIPANMLENIELITAPSAKYDPDGKGGIINIITKKGATNGLTLAANTLAGLPSTKDYGNKKSSKRFGGDLTINAKSDKWDISAGGNYTRNDNAGYREGDVSIKNFTTNTITRFPSNGERSFDKYNYAGRTTISFTPDTMNTLSAGFFAGKRYQARLADLLYNNTTSNLTTNALQRSTTYFNSNLQTKQGNFTLGNFDYTHKFSDKSTIAVSALYERARLYGNTSNKNLNHPNNAIVIQDVYNPYENPINGYRFKLDHALPLGGGKLETGYQFRYDTQDGKFEYSVTPAASQPDAARFRGTAKAKNQINSVYSQYSGKSGKLEYVGGLRYEYAARTVNLSYDPNPHILNLSNLFPSANLLYNISTGWKAKAGYSKRVQRRNNFELNPIPEREHSETLEQGDPDLLPEFIDLAELGLIRNFSSGSFFTTLYYQGIKNPIQRVNSVYADSILNRVFTNASRARSFGVEMGTNLQPAKWWTLYLGANLYNYKVNGTINILDVSSPINNTAWVYSFNANTGFKLSSTWSLQGNLNYLSERPTAQGKDSRFIVPNTSVKKTLMKGQLSASLQWQNMDLGTNHTQRQRITTMGREFYTTTNYIYETDVFLLNFSFNLNRLSSKSKLPASEFGDKEF